MKIGWRTKTRDPRIPWNQITEPTVPWSSFTTKREGTQSHPSNRIQDSAQTSPLYIRIHGAFGSSFWGSSAPASVYFGIPGSGFHPQNPVYGSVVRNVPKTSFLKEQQLPGTVCETPDPGSELVGEEKKEGWRKGRDSTQNFQHWLARSSNHPRSRPKDRKAGRSPS